MPGAERSDQLGPACQQHSEPASQELLCPSRVPAVSQPRSPAGEHVATREDRFNLFNDAVPHLTTANASGNTTKQSIPSPVKPTKKKKKKMNRWNRR